VDRRSETFSDSEAACLPPAPQITQRKENHRMQRVMTTTKTGHYYFRVLLAAVMVVIPLRTGISLNHHLSAASTTKVLQGNQTFGRRAFLRTLPQSGWQLQTGGH
jgi:hypothetical protein